MYAAILSKQQCLCANVAIHCYVLSNASVNTSLPPVSQLPNSVTTPVRTTAPSFIPTSVIRNMAGLHTADGLFSMKIFPFE